MSHARPSRRSVLAGGAALLAAVTLVACGRDEPSTATDEGAAGSAAKGSATAPLARPETLSQAPEWEAKVASGDLPPLEERLPEHPYVVPHRWVSRGTYGGMLQSIIGDTSADWSPREWFYGASPLRLLNDGLDIGPGWVETWEANDDTSVWTFHLRKGLRWSDGKPATTADVMFWWNDMVLFDGYSASPPDEAKSGTGTVASVEAVDETTFTLTFDAPAPLTAERLALMTRGFGGVGPSWIVPAHYAKRFHPTYTKGLGDEWATAFDAALLMPFTNPDAPSLNEFVLAEFNEGRSLVWKRNPYCYVVGPDGDQLPYLDGMLMLSMANTDVAKVKIGAGDVDYSHGPFNGLTLADVSTIKKQAPKAGNDVLLWNSGSGTGSVFFLCYDYRDKQYRELFRDPRFRQALSLAFDRAEAKKAIYFGLGEETTGTMSPKAVEYLVNDEGRSMYTQWRDSYVALDRDRADALLDELGLTERDDEGMRTWPDGQEFTLRLETTGSTKEHEAKDAQLVRDFGKVGIRFRLNPVPPISYGDNWAAGKYMARSDWEVSDGPNHLVYPQWFVPCENSRWAPLEGTMYQARGTDLYDAERDVDPYKRKPPRMEAEEDGPIKALWTNYDKACSTTDGMERHRIVWDMIKIHVEQGPFFMGVVADTPQMVVVHKDLRNVPRAENLALGGYVNTWVHPTPAVYDPSIYYWENPDDHTV